MKNFYETYRDDAKLYALCREISWSNNRRILSLKTAEERELEKQINKSLFERVMLVEKKLSETVKQLPQDTKGIR